MDGLSKPFLIKKELNLTENENLVQVNVLYKEHIVQE